MAAAAGGLSAAVVLMSGAPAPALVVLAAAAVLQTCAQVGMHRTRDETETGRPIADGVRAFVLFAMAMTLANRPDWWAWLVPFYLLFELALRVRPAEGQV
jgi:hypothetical protein